MAAGHPGGHPAKHEHTDLFYQLNKLPLEESRGSGASSPPEAVRRDFFPEERTDNRPPPVYPLRRWKARTAAAAAGDGRHHEGGRQEGAAWKESSQLAGPHRTGMAPCSFASPPYVGFAYGYIAPPPLVKIKVEQHRFR